MERNVIIVVVVIVALAFGALVWWKQSQSTEPASTPLPFTLTAVPEDAPRIGLGLEASRWLAEREGGCLTLEAVPGGTRAVLTLRA